MTKVKNTISGRLVSPRIIRVVDSSGSRLIPGQKVLIYKTTDKNIIGSSGKKIGKKEQVLGSGKVKVAGSQILVESPRAVGIVPMYKIKTSAPLGVRVSGKAHLGYRSAKSKAIDQKVLIKVIEE